MAIGDTITASRYNQIQSTVEFVLGVGNGDAGYGIQTTSSQIQAGNIVTAADINKLRADILAIYIHQRGSNIGFSTKKFNAATDVDSANNIFTITNHELATGQRVVYTVSASTTVIPGLINNRQYLVEVIDQSRFVLTSIDNQVVNIIGVSTGTHRFSTNLVKKLSESVNDADYITLDNLINILLNNRNQLEFESIGNNFTLEASRITSVRTNSWGGAAQAQSVFHEVSVEFDSLNARRYFFNTGSEIVLEASLTNFSGDPGSLLKFNNWSQLLSAISSVRFKSFETSVIGSGTTQAIGNFNLTNSYQTIFTKSGSGLYSDNTYVIKARSVNSRTISFLIEFNDLYVGTGNPNFLGEFGLDEKVEGRLSSRVSQLRATGTLINNIIKVIAPAPLYKNLKEVSVS